MGKTSKPFSRWIFFTTLFFLVSIQEAFVNLLNFQRMQAILYVAIVDTVGSYINLLTILYICKKMSKWPDNLSSHSLSFILKIVSINTPFRLGLRDDDSSFVPTISRGCWQFHWGCIRSEEQDTRNIQTKQKKLWACPILKQTIYAIISLLSLFDWEGILGHCIF